LFTSDGCFVLRHKINISLQALCKFLKNKVPKMSFTSGDKKRLREMALSQEQPK